MDDMKIRELIEKDSLEIPNSLQPDNIRKMLDNTTDGRHKRKTGRIFAFTGGAAAIAAGVILCIILLNSRPVGNHMTADDKYSTVYDRIISSVDNKSEDLAWGAEENGGTEEFSETNTQVDGIDEINKIQTDGHQIYAINDFRNEIIVYDASDGVMNQINTIVIKDRWEVNGIYLMSDKQLLIVVSSTPLQTTASYYDISNLSDITMTSQVTQSGVYGSSRIKDDYLYVFSEYSVYDSDIKKDDYETYIAQVNGECVVQESYIFSDNNDGADQTVISAQNITRPQEEHNQLVLLGNGDNYYVSQKYIYMYSWDIADDNQEGEYYNTTEITRIAYNKINFAATGTVHVPGSVDGRYAFNEKDGYLRIATTVNPYKISIQGDVQSYEALERYSGIYIYDNSLKPAGQLDGIAPGEQIKSVNYIDDTAYIVTFLNTDPLFKIDVSDPAEPKLIGQLEITGYSEYLTQWTDGLLLGIGLEADTNGVVSGLKLNMYSISGSTDPKTIDSTAIDYPDSYIGLPWEDNPEYIMLDRDKSIVGFPYMIFSYEDQPAKNMYALYKYSEDGFTCLGQIDGNTKGMMMSVYIGSYVYVTDTEGKNNQTIALD